jgi:hypothetical protein
LGEAVRESNTWFLSRGREDEIGTETAIGKESAAVIHNCLEKELL